MNTLYISDRGLSIFLMAKNLGLKIMHISRRRPQVSLLTQDGEFYLRFINMYGFLASGRNRLVIGTDGIVKTAQSCGQKISPRFAKNYRADDFAIVKPRKKRYNYL